MKPLVATDPAWSPVVEILLVSVVALIVITGFWAGYDGVRKYRADRRREAVRREQAAEQPPANPLEEADFILIGCNCQVCVSAAIMLARRITAQRMADAAVAQLRDELEAPDAAQRLARKSGGAR